MIHTEHPRSRRSRLIAALVVAPVLALLAACSTPAAPDPGSSAASEGLIDAARCAENKAAGKITFVNTFGYGRPEILTAIEKGWYADLCLDVEHVTDTKTGMQIVSAGTAQITSTGGISNAIQYAEQGLNVTAIATSAYASSYTLLTQKSITDLKQLDGKIIGYHTILPIPLTQMLTKAGVDIDSIQWINDTTYNPTLLTQGQYDAIQAYKNNEPLTLKDEGLEFNQFDPEDWGIDGSSNIFVANSTFLQEHRTAVQDFLLATYHATEYCEADIDECIDIIAKKAEADGQQYDRKHNADSWMIVRNQMTSTTLPGKGVGQQTPESWQAEFDTLVEFDQLDDPGKVDLTKLVDSSLMDELYDGQELRWPGED